MYSVGIFLFHDMELLDFAGPYEVFSVTGELNDGALRVFTITRDGNAVKTVNGLTVLPDYGFFNHPAIDILVIPGGMGTKAEITKDDALRWISEVHQNAKLTMSVCSGARLLGKLGLLDTKECTTHHEVMDALKEIAPTAILTRERFTGDGRLYTSAGISAGIDLSLHIVETLFGRDVVQKTKVYMEYGEWEADQRAPSTI
jgi:transcriptional regulator GlxA family with amidase domain